MLILHGRGAAAISSRVGIPIAFGSPGQRGRQFPPKPEREVNPGRLGGQVNICPLSLATPAGGALSGSKARPTFVSFPSPGSPPPKAAYERFRTHARTGRYRIDHRSEEHT